MACSAEGAALCYQEICRLGARASSGAHDHPRITLDSIPLARWMPAFDAGDDEALAAIMLESTALLAAAGADFAVPDNSAHVAWRHFEPASPIPWLHIARVVADEPAARGCRRVGVLGTRFTMGGPVYPEALARSGIDVVVPDADDAAMVDRIIFDELVAGVDHRRSARAYQDVIERLARPRLRRGRPGVHRDPAADRTGRLRAPDARLDPAARGRGARPGDGGVRGGSA